MNVQENYGDFRNDGRSVSWLSLNRHYDTDEIYESDQWEYEKEKSLYEDISRILKIVIKFH